MKIPTLLLLSSLAVASSALAADSSVTLKSVHLCCTECVRGVERSVKGIDGLTLKADKDAETVTLTAADKKTLQKAVTAMAEGGYYGVSDLADVKPVANTGARGKTVQTMIVTGTHLCCAGCTKAVDRAVKKTPGATAHTAKKGSVTFNVTGNFNDQAFFEALQSEGLSGRITDKEAPAPAPAKAKDGKDH